LLGHRADESEREREEATRILYVATTRARDLLVVPVLGDERREGWLGALNPVVYPPEEAQRAPRTRHAPGCPPFGTDSVADRPERAPGSARAVAPGLHAPEQGTHTVVWWDPATLELNVEERVGLRQQMLLAADDKRQRSEEGVRAHAAWVAEQGRTRAAAAVPWVEVVTATEWGARHVEDPDPPDVVVERLARADEAGPGGVRFGTLVHAVLATVDLEAGQAAVEQVARQHARVLGAPAAERDAAVARTVRALAAPLLRRAAAAGRAGLLRREVPVALRGADGALIEGVVDLAFADPADGGAWTVVDFKTDRVLETRLSEYRWQVDAYARAIAAATGQPARAVLLQV
jgi:ATP-dependent exoDNAse (exonuclease V) beta subunit